MGTPPISSNAVIWPSRNASCPCVEYRASVNNAPELFSAAAPPAPTPSAPLPGQPGGGGPTAGSNTPRPGHHVEYERTTPFESPSLPSSSCWHPNKPDATTLRWAQLKPSLPVRRVADGPGSSRHGGLDSSCHKHRVRIWLASCCCGDSEWSVRPRRTCPPAVHSPGAAGFYLVPIVTRSEYVGCVATVQTRPSSESEELGMTANGSSAKALRDVRRAQSRRKLAGISCLRSLYFERRLFLRPW